LDVLVISENKRLATMVRRRVRVGNGLKAWMKGQTGMEWNPM